MWAQIRAWFTDNHREMLMRHNSSDWGEHALVAACSILDWGEEGANNKGPEITLLRRGKLLKKWQRGEWCAVACSYEIEEGWAGVNGYSRWDWMPRHRQLRCPVKRSRGAIQLGNRIAKAGCLVSDRDVRPGDFAVYSRKGGGHIAIVSEVRENGYQTIDGNKGRFNKRTKQGSKVRKFEHEWNEPNLKFFARLPSISKGTK